MKTVSKSAKQFTWFINKSVPAFNPPATLSSNAFSNLFFSLTTAFKKSVLSICGAYGSPSSVTQYTKPTHNSTHQFLVKIYLNHRLDHISNMYKFKELHKRSDTGSFLMFCGFILCHPFSSPNIPQKSASTHHENKVLLRESFRDMPFPKSLQHQYKKFLNRIPHPMPIMSRIPSKRFCTFQSLTISMY